MIQPSLLKVTVAVALMLLSGIVRADGLIQSLPEDGSWALFEMEFQFSKEGSPATKSIGTQKVSSVGREIVDGEPCRWIEFKSHRKLNNELKEQSEIFKMLIPEKRLTAGESPLDHLIQGWTKIGPGKHPQTGAIIDFESKTPTDMRPRGKDIGINRLNLASVVSAPIQDVRNLDQEIIECKRGKFACRGIAGKQTISFQSAATGGDHFSYETRLNTEVPFGVVTHRCQSKRELSDGKWSPVTAVWSFKLIDFGKDAVTEIPEPIDGPRAFGLYNSAKRFIDAGDYYRAQNALDEAVKIARNFAFCRELRGVVFFRVGEYEKAIADFRHAMQVDPKYVDTYIHYATLLAACSEEKFRDGKQAVELATKGCELSEWKNAQALQALAAAHAESGDFSQGVKWQLQAVELASTTEKADSQLRLELYKAGKPYRAEPVKKSN